MRCRARKSRFDADINRAHPCERGGMSEKPLFIPLKAERYEAFESGVKDTEYRAYDCVPWKKLAEEIQAALEGK